MSLLFYLQPPLFYTKPHSLHPHKTNLFKPHKPLAVKSLGKNQGHVPSPEKPRWEHLLSTLASLYPVYVTVGGAIACVNPSAFQWFVKRGPASYSFSLGLIMLAMGLTLELKELVGIFKEKPLSILFGCFAQYTIMPAFGTLVSKVLGLPPSLSVGLILLGCCPGGTASNVVTLIAQGDVPLSIVMTVCTTLGAVLLTPLLTKILAGAYVPIDALGLSISTLQIVVAPILLGSYIQSTFPLLVKAVIPFAPLFAVLASSLLASSVFSENFVRLKSSLASTASASGDMKTVLLAVVLLHFAGFLIGYLSAMVCGFKEKQRRAISIEVGMQNSSLGVVLATSHFGSPLVALPPALSAVVMNIMGSSLGFVWRYITPSDLNQQTESQD
ncbi:putative sodium/metabolite cotransporter BASS1, chloroplastic isoform X1 [Carex rostrata]